MFLYTETMTLELEDEENMLSNCYRYLLKTLLHALKPAFILM